MFTIYSNNIQGLQSTDKKVILLQFVSKYRPSVILLQETNMDTGSVKFQVPNYRFFSNDATSHASGLVIYVSKDIKVESHSSLVPAKLQKVVISHAAETYSIYNVHMPHNDKEAMCLVSTLRSDLNSSSSTHHILGGDWNFVENLALDKFNSVSDRPRLRSLMTQMLNDFNLVDIFRHLNPRKRVTTHTGVQVHKPKARLDRIYVSVNLVSRIGRVGFLPPISDHSIVWIGVSGDGGSRRSVYWRMPLRTLSSQYFVRDCSELLDEFILCESKSIQKYESLKFEIKRITMLHSSLAALQSNIEHKRIERLHNHDNSKELFKEFLASSSNLDSNVLNPDRLNRKFTQYRDTIPVTSVREGESEETRSSHFHTYYRNILKRDNVDSSMELHKYLEDLPKVEEEKSSMFEGNMSWDEIRTAIGQLKTGCAPGLDGLPTELYQVFKDKFGVILEWLWSECVRQSLLPPSMRTGVVSLIYKRGDPEDLGNWRPITMSNTDFKVFAIVLKNRISTVLSELIGPYQTCNVQGRSIYDNLSFLRDNLDSGNGALLNLDQ